MEKKTVKLDTTILEKLKVIKQKERDIIFDYGQVGVERQNAQVYLNELNNQLTEIYAKVQQVQNELDKVLLDLDKQYPNGEIDLEKGIISY